MAEKITGIYMIRNLKNEKVYIGQSVNIYKRWREHKSNLNKNKHPNVKLQNAWNKYGDNSFSFSVLLTCSKADLNEHEKFFVDKYDSYKNGYNMTLGGNDATSYTKEFKEKISNTKNNFSKERKDEIRKKMLESHEWQNIPIYQLDLNGDIIKLWPSIKFAAYTLKINYSCIQNCLNLKRKTYKGSIWIREKDYENFDLSIYKNIKCMPKKIIQKRIDGYVVKEWNSSYEAGKHGFDSSSVIKCCKGKYKTYKGYKWEYAD